MSAAVEAAAKEPFLTFMRDQVFDRLNMRDTRAESATNELADRATFYFPRFAADPRYGPDLMRELDLSCYAGSGVFLSTPSDLVRFGIDPSSALRRSIMYWYSIESSEGRKYGGSWASIAASGDRKSVV